MINLESDVNKTSLMPDMTALLDVIFILLIFMLLTANVAPQLLDLELPKHTAPSQAVSDSAITLGLTENGGYAIDQSRYETWSAFKAALQARIVQAEKQQDEIQLLVAADKDVPLQPFIKLAGWLSTQGLSVAEIIVENE